MWRYRRALAHVLVASLFIQLFALVTPLFFQIVIDKVLVHKAMSTLTLIVIGLAAIGVEPQIALDTKLFLVRISRETGMSLPIKLLQSEAVTKIYISLAGSDTLMAFPEHASQNSVNGHGAMAAF
jgi:ABC-type bacteriocin/lantibiotic exporter with double-glycine peptidase domain